MDFLIILTSRQDGVGEIHTIVRMSRQSVGPFEEKNAVVLGLAGTIGLIETKP